MTQTGTPISLSLEQYHEVQSHAENHGYAEGYQAALAAVASSPCAEDWRCVLGGAVHEAHVHAKNRRAAVRTEPPQYEEWQADAILQRQREQLESRDESGPADVPWGRIAQGDEPGLTWKDYRP